MQNILFDDEMLSKVRSFNDEYYHRNEIRYRVNDDELDEIWAIVKTIRNATSRRIRIGDIDIKFNITPDMGRMLHDIDRWSMGEDDRRSSDRYWLSSVMEEAIASSQMEGASVTRDLAKRMLRRDSPAPKTTGERMVMNNYRTMLMIKDTSKNKMTTDLILSMHKRMTDDLLGGWEGRFREDNEIVVGDPLESDVIYHRPPDCKNVPYLMQSLCDFANSEEYVHPVIKAIIMHFMVGHIHPFVDGNGRIARTLFYWYAVKKGYDVMEYASLSRVIKRKRGKYNEAYQFSESDGNDVTYFIRYNLQCLTEALDDLGRYLRRKNEEELSIDTGGGMNRTESLIVMDYERSRQAFTAREISSRYGVSYQTARNYVSHLLEMHQIGEAGKERKTVLYRVLCQNENKP